MKPTLLPTITRSLTPSILPTIAPSFRPTPKPGDPTLAPTVSSHPSTQPSSSPTSSPSYNANYRLDETYRHYVSLMRNYSSSSGSDSVLFGEFFFRGSVVEGSCSDWTAFVDYSLHPPIDELYFSKLTARSTSYSFNDHKHRSVSVQCSDVTAVGKIVRDLGSRVSGQHSCDGLTWTVFQCDGSMALCVGCDIETACADPCASVASSDDGDDDVFILKPCKECQAQVSAASTLNIEYKLRVNYPQIVSPLLDGISVTRNWMQILVNISSAGDVFCAALKPGAVIASVQDIRNSINAGSTIVDSPGSSTVEINGLSPFTTYAVYCYTDDFIDHAMPLSEALLTRSLVSTLCCKQLLILQTHPTIVQYVPGNSSSADPLFRFALDSTPVGAVSIQLGVTRSASCSGPNPTTIIISPQLFHFDSSSLSLAGSFTVRGREPGCFLVELRSTHSDHDHYAPVNVSVAIRSISTAPDPPRMSIVSFNGEGTALFVSFDSESNRGASVVSYPDRPFQCSLLISLVADSDIIGNSTRCIWFNNSHIMVDIIASGVQPNVGDLLTLRKGILTAVCLIDSDDCSRYPSNDEQVLGISPPISKAVTPAVSLVSPSSLAFCADLVIDPTASTGSCGRDWESVQWSVTQSGMVAQNAADIIAAHLNSNYSAAGTSQVVVVPNRLLMRSTDLQLSSFTIYLQLTNFLGKTAKHGLVVAIDSSSTVLLLPSVYLVSSESLSYRWKTTNLFASASYAACLGMSDDASFAYSWAVYKGASYMPALTSNSRQPRYFTLDPYSLDASATYSVVVTVSASSSSSSSSSSAATVVTARALIQVGSSGVRAALRGGSMRTVSSSSIVSLDASPSTDIDYPASSNAGLTFVWQCIETQPIYGGSCSLPFGRYSGQVLALPEGSLGPNVYVITVTVSNAVGATDSASLRLTVVASIIPVLQMDRVAPKYNVDSKLVLSGTVTSSLNRAVGVEWSCTSISSFSSSGMALTPLTLSVAAFSSQMFQLAIAADTLLPGLQYSFQLAATYATSTIVAVAVVVVTMNSPPSGGSLLVHPTTGLALVTLFSLSAVKWIDDSSDLPLSYEFAYYLINAAELNFVKTADVTSHVSTILGQGLYSMNYQVSCVAIVSDIHGSSANATTLYPIAVSPPPPPPMMNGTRQLDPSGSFSANVVDSIERSIQRDLVGFNPSNVVRMVDATLSTMNSVDCSNITVDCTALNRQLCSTTANTCGGCLSGYIGLSGDSNTPCGLQQSSSSSSLRRIDEACSDARMCMTGSCVEGRCSGGPKTCPSGCSDHGRCFHYDGNRQVVQEEDCRVSDSNCQAHCLCDDGYYGAACDVGLSSYGEAVWLREYLCRSIHEASFMQDPTATAIRSRSLTVGSILSDMSLINEAALTNCTSALINIIVENPSLSCISSSSYGLSLAALSNMLNILSTPHHAAMFAHLASTLVSQVSLAIEQLMRGCQEGLAIGEAPIGVVHPNLRVMTSKMNQSSLGDAIFRIPINSFESFSGSLASNITLDKSFLSSSESLGLTMYEFSRNTRAEITNSSRLVVQTHVYGSTASSATASKLTVSLRNNEPIQYESIDPSNVTLSCEVKSLSSQQPYAIVERCPDGSTINVTCPGDLRAEYSVSCPGRITAPKCQVTDEDAQSDWSCAVADYDAFRTTCDCMVKSRARRHLADTGTDTLSSSRKAELSSASTSRSVGVLSSTYTPFASEAASSSAVGMSSVIIILITSVCAFLAFLVGSYLACKHHLVLSRTIRKVIVSEGDEDRTESKDDDGFEGLLIEREEVAESGSRTVPSPKAAALYAVTSLGCDDDVANGTASASSWLGGDKDSSDILDETDLYVQYLDIDDDHVLKFDAIGNLIDDYSRKEEAKKMKKMKEKEELVLYSNEEDSKDDVDNDASPIDEDSIQISIVDTKQPSVPSTAATTEALPSDPVDYKLVKESFDKSLSDLLSHANEALNTYSLPVLTTQAARMHLKARANLPKRPPPSSSSSSYSKKQEEEMAELRRKAELNRFYLTPKRDGTLPLTGKTVDELLWIAGIFGVVAKMKDNGRLKSRDQLKRDIQDAHSLCLKQAVNTFDLAERALEKSIHDLLHSEEVAVDDRGESPLKEVDLSSVQARELKLKLFLVYGDKSRNFDLVSDTSYIEKVEATLVPTACSEEQCD